MLVYARMTSLWPAVAVVVLIGIPNAALNVAITPLLLLVTPRALVGRAMAILTPAITWQAWPVWRLAGYLASVTLVDFHEEALGFTFGPVDTIFMAGGLIALLGGVYCALRLRSAVIEREHVREEPEVYNRSRTGAVASWRSGSDSGFRLEEICPTCAPTRLISPLFIWTRALARTYNGRRGDGSHGKRLPRAVAAHGVWRHNRGGQTWAKRRVPHPKRRRNPRRPRPPSRRRPVTSLAR